MGISFRLATPKDAYDMAEIHIRSWEIAYKEIIPKDFITEKNSTRHSLYKLVITNENRNSYIIEFNGNVVGIMKVALPQDEDVTNNTYELHYIYLHPNYFRMGIGTQAMEFAYTIARGLNKTIMTVWVLSENINSIKFYEKCGFTPDGKTKNMEYGRSVKCIRMIKKFE